jgi:hypothetical protein
MSTENQTQGGNDNQKVVKAYEKNLKKLVSIIGGTENLNPITTVKKDVLESLVSELFKEETEAIEKSTKEALKTLLKNRVEMQRSIAAKKKELDQLEVSKMKEFNEASVKLFKQINGVDELEKEFYSALTDATTAEDKLAVKEVNSEEEDEEDED